SAPVPPLSCATNMISAALPFSRGFLDNLGEVTMRISVAMLLIAVASVRAAAQDSSSKAELINSEIDTQLALMNKRVPIYLSPVEKVVGLSRDGKAIIYHVEIAVPQDEWTQEMRDKSSRGITKVICSNTGMRTLLDVDYELRYLFSDKAGLSVTSLVVTKDKCSDLLLR